jgi:hypothetical protein
MGSPPTLDPNSTDSPVLDEPDRDRELAAGQRELLEHPPTSTDPTPNAEARRTSTS